MTLNIQSILLLAAILLLAFIPLFRYLKKGSKCSGCSGCSGCSLKDQCSGMSR